MLRAAALPGRTSCIASSLPAAVGDGSVESESASCWSFLQVASVRLQNKLLSTNLKVSKPSPLITPCQVKFPSACPLRKAVFIAPTVQFGTVDHNAEVFFRSTAPSAVKPTGLNLGHRSSAAGSGSQGKTAGYPLLAFRRIVTLVLFYPASFFPSLLQASTHFCEFPQEDLSCICCGYAHYPLVATPQCRRL